MQQIYITFLIVLAFSIVFALIAKSQGQTKKKAALPALSKLSNVMRREPMTRREQEMYTALSASLPECVVLAQVAFSALLTTSSKPTRNRFDRKVADFVICSRQFTVIAIIELDDASHKYKAADDQERDAMLNNVGYKTIRYKNVPDHGTIQKDVVGRTENERIEQATA